VAVAVAVVVVMAVEGGGLTKARCAFLSLFLAWKCLGAPHSTAYRVLRSALLAGPWVCAAAFSS
jgi:hypothetical protein